VHSVRTFVAPLTAPLTAFVGALIGAYMAWAWFADKRVIAVVCAAALVGVGIVCLGLGAAALPNRPVLAVRLMNSSLLAYVGLIAVAAASAIVVSVALVAQTDASEETKKLLSAVATAVTTFLGAVFVAGDKSDAALGEAVRAQFYAAYDRASPNQVPHNAKYLDASGKRLFPPDTDGVNALFGEGWHDLTGWGSPTRLKRAKAIQAYMKEEGL
jgi:hypothetical protein